MKNKIWAFGGSIIGGHALPEKSMAYPYLLANELNLEIINHGDAGTGVRYAFECLLKADIKKGDIVLLDVTLPEWIRFHKGTAVQNLKVKDLSKEELKFWSDNQIFYEHTTFVNAFVKYARLLDVKLNLHSFLPNWNDTWIQCKEFYKDFDEYLEFSSCVEDYADDVKLHPGPVTNVIISNKLLEFFK